MKTIIVIIFTAVATLSACTGRGTGPGADPRGAGDDVSADSAVSGSSVPIGSAVGSCVEEYSLDTVTKRSFAFDGTVAQLGDEPESEEAGPYVDATFKVHDWFRGGDRDQVTVQVITPAVVTSVGHATYGVGSRLLVSGEPRWGGAPLDSPIAWACGFTRTYDAETASAWRDAFSSSGRK